jgi:hypothetical protein
VSHTRATVLSMNSQADAVGQIAGGPPLGVLANRTSSATALVASAVVLSPIVIIYSLLRPARASAPDAETPTSRSIPIEHAELDSS